MTSFASAVIAGASHHQPILHAPNTTHNTTLVEEQLCEVFNTQVPVGGRSRAREFRKSRNDSNCRVFQLNTKRLSCLSCLRILSALPVRFKYRLACLRIVFRTVQARAQCGLRAIIQHSVSRVAFPHFQGYATSTVSIQTDQGLRPLITASCSSSMVSISHNMAGDVEATNQHRERRPRLSARVRQ